jgi:protein CpxP
MNSPTPVGSPRRSYRGLIIAGIFVAILGVLVAGKAYVFAQAEWHHGWGGGPMNAEAVADHIEHGVKYVLSDVDATADQKAKVTAIMEAAAKDVFALHDQHFADAKRIHEILSAPSIDRESLEAVRADEMKLADQASKRIVQGIADSAEVLTPEQRTQLAQKMEARHNRWQKGSH